MKFHINDYPEPSTVNEIIFHSQTSTARPLKFGYELVISSHTWVGVWLLIHAGIKIDTC